MMRRTAIFLLVFFLPLYHAFSCPVCSTSTGEQVRAGIFNADFISTALMVLAPFPVCIGIILLLHFGLPWRKKGEGGTGGNTHTVNAHRMEQLPERTMEAS